MRRYDAREGAPVFLLYNLDYQRRCERIRWLSTDRSSGDVGLSLWAGFRWGASMRDGLKRAAICVFIPLILVTGCVSGGQLWLFSPGELHNDGVRYVLERLKKVPKKKELQSSVTNLVAEYCTTIGMRCSVLVPVPSFPLNMTRIINSSAGSRELKSKLRSLFQAIPKARNIPDLEASLTRIEREASGTLSRPESEHFSNVVSIARSSARLWAPVDQGGRNGASIVLPARVSTGSGGGPALKINWAEVAAADAFGCAVSGPFCVAGAILYSVADILLQLSND
jgi:hypothetical protein